LEGADLILEVVPEKPDIKRQVYKEIDQFARPDAVMASNTSYLNIFPFVAPRRQKNCLIAHWYTPPYIIDLVDIVPGPETDPEIIQANGALADHLVLLYVGTIDLYDLDPLDLLITKSPLSLK
jgi:3-hydroxybutyryl-CoA dehydrogenase